MHRISYIITSLIIVLSMATITALTKSDWPIDTGIQSEAGIVMDVGFGTVPFIQNIHEQGIPTSITKLLTALMAIENTNDLNASVTFSHDVTYNAESRAGNKFSLKEGDVLSVRQCLYAMLLQSFNRSANALVEYVAGGRQAFMDTMSQWIAEFGCNESHFANPSGLNDNIQYTTTYDMAIITRACFRSPTVPEIASTRTSTMLATTNNPNGRTFSIEHKMLLSNGSNYYPDTITDKTGWTSQTGQTLATHAGREGRGQIAVTFKSTQKTHYSDTKAVLDFCFAEFKSVNAVDNETEYVIGGTPVTIAGETYDPSELSIGSGAVIIISSDTQFTDADKVLETDSSGDYSQEAVARLVYTYNERRVRGAWIYSSRVQAINAAPSEPGEDTPQEDQPEKGGQDGKTGLKLLRVVLIGDGAALVLVLITGGGVSWLKKRQAAERGHQRIFRKKCRQRLTGIGYTEEDFERLSNERKKQHDIR